jgi:hypothetical protein
MPEKFTALTFLFSLSAMLSVFGCKEAKKSSGEWLRYPPFSIQKRSITDRQYKPNEGTTSELIYTKYTVLYHDQEIEFPETLGANTGISGIWKTYYLKNARTPALLVAGKNVFLVTEENDAASIIPFENNFSSYASIQWLDENGGQPGQKTQILIGLDTTDCLLDGGDFLLVNETTVLQINDLQLFHFVRNPDQTEGYFANQVVAFSPDQKDIVFMGSKSPETDATQFIHALLVYNFKTNDVYTLAFDKTQTRLHLPYEADFSWFTSYFEWRQNEEGKIILAKKELKAPATWEGYFTKNESYELAPVVKEMHAAFVRFVIEYLHVKQEDVRAEAYGNLEKFSIQHLGVTLDITYLKELSTVSLSSSFMNKEKAGEANALIRKAGEAFNDSLRQGAYQQLFTGY